MLAMSQKRLFSQKVITKACEGFASAIPAEHLKIIEDWQTKTSFGGKETHLDGLYISQFLCGLLGYEETNASEQWTIQKNTKIGTGNVDAAIGYFKPQGQMEIKAPFELKGPDTKDLDAIMPGRHKSPVQQAWEYAMDAKGVEWVLVSNMLEIRLYAFGYGRQAYEVFYLKDLNKPEEYHKFQLLLSKTNLLGGKSFELLKLSEQADKDITNQLYKDYKTLRNNLIHGLRQHNSTLNAEDAVQYAQTILDRVLFIAFAEDTALLPENSLRDAYTTTNDYIKQSSWERFVKLFGWVDKGFPERKIPPYNGGLFKKNTAIDKLTVPDEICQGFEKIGAYDFASEISVNILGHIFEQSITDLEEIKASLEETDFDAKKGKRKKDGVFYTPDYITRYIVEQAVGGWLEERRIELGFYKLPELDPDKDYAVIKTNMSKKAKKSTSTTLTPKAKKYIAYWKAYKKALSNIKVLDPACGSGAFLVQAFDYLKEEGQRINAELAQLQGGMEDIFERLDTSILKNNLYGVDLNPESVEITKLSLWLKTANSGEKLTYLDDNIQCGNSIISDPQFAGDAAFNWKESFSTIMQKGGFDVVVGNPPYVRMEHLKPVKPYLEKNYITASDRADLFVYFYEQGIKILKPSGWLGYISNNTFFKTGAGQNLREFLLKNVSLERIVDFGDTQIFEGATTYPAIMLMTKGSPNKKHEISFTTVTDDAVNFSTLEEPAPTYKQADLGSDSWQLEANDIAAIRQKIISKHKMLKEVYGSPMYGIKTGCNEAFVIDQATRDSIVSADSKAADLIKPFLEGKDFHKWYLSSRKLFLINIPKDSILIDSYPSIKSHLLNFKKTLSNRATKQNWYELQQAQLAYQPYMNKPKIIYGHFCPEPLFSIDVKGFFSNNKSYFIPVEDWYLLALLSSKSLWLVFTGMTTAVKGGYYEATAQHIEKLPIPKAKPEQKAALGELAKDCQTAAEARYTTQQAVIQRIPDLAPDAATAKLNKKLQHWWELDFPAFRTEIKKVFKQDIPLADRSDWEKFLNTHRQQITDYTNQINQLEAQINQQVYTLFGLTNDEIAVIEGSV